MCKMASSAKFVALCVLIQQAYGNIWDNLFSQYSTPLVPLTAPTSMKFELQEFSLLMPIFVRIDYYGSENAIAFTLGRDDTDAGQIVLDFKNSYARIVAIDEKRTISPETCAFHNLPTALRADITDLNNLLRYFAFEEKPSDAYTNTKTYRLNLLGLESKLIPFTNNTFPQTQIKLQKNQNNQFTGISVALGDTVLTLKRSNLELSTNNTPTALTPLDRDRCVEAAAVSDTRSVLDRVGRYLLGSQVDAVLALLQLFGSRT